MPNPGVATPAEQLDESYAFGTATTLVAEWRKLWEGGGRFVSRVERAQTAMRMRELEVEYHLALPPDT